LGCLEEGVLFDVYQQGQSSQLHVKDIIDEKQNAGPILSFKQRN